MKRFWSYICLLMVCGLCGAEEITIRPQFSVGETLKYRSTAQLTMFHEQDSVIAKTSLLPKFVIESKNDTGFVMLTSNKLEYFKIESSDPQLKELLPDRKEEMNKFVAPVKLKIQLDAECRPDTILNLQQVKESLLEAYLNMYKNSSDLGDDDIEEWESETVPLLTATVDMIYTPEHLIETQMGNIPYFNFIGIPLKSGEIPASMVLTNELQKMCPNIKELKFKISQTTDNKEHSIDASDGFYTIKIAGKDETTVLGGEFLYAKGILEHGLLWIKINAGNGKIASIFSMNPVE